MRSLKTEELNLVAGAACEVAPSKKGNNGWGNGAEGITPGSCEGATAGSKLDQVWNGPADGPQGGTFTTR